MKRLLPIGVAVALSCAPDRNETDAAGCANQFFEACAAVDTATLNRISAVAEYPLVKSWTIRRVGEETAYLETTRAGLMDSVSSIESRHATLDTRMRTLKNNTDSLTKEYLLPADSLREEYERLEREYQQAHDSFAQSQTYVIDKLERASELGRKRDQARDRFLRAAKAYEQNATGPLAQMGADLSRLQIEDSTLTVQLRDWKTIQLAVQRSISESKNVLSAPISVTTASAIADLEIPSRLGVVLSKKCSVTLLRTDQLRSRWIVTRLDYLGDQ